MSAEIRRGWPGDEGLFSCIADGVFDYAVDPARLADYHLVVAIAGGEIVGQVSAMAEGSRVGREQGCREAWVGTESDNGPATNLYEERGAKAEAFVMYVFRA
jgi:hypothetical protein